MQQKVLRFSTRTRSVKNYNDDNNLWGLEDKKMEDNSTSTPVLAATEEVDTIETVHSHRGKEDLGKHTFSY